jgi:hypothetical protein
LALQTHDRAVEAGVTPHRANREHHVLQQALSVAAAKAKLTGLVVAAAALGGTAVAAGSTAFVPTAGDETVVTAPTDSPSPEVVPTTDPTPDVNADVTPEATRTPLPCPSDVANHGAYVSQVAHDKTVKGREHGQAVSEAAKSDCGKPAGDAADAESSDAPEVEASEAPDADDADDAGDTLKPQRAQKHGKGHKRS